MRQLHLGHVQRHKPRSPILLRVQPAGVLDEVFKLSLTKPTPTPREGYMMSFVRTFILLYTLWCRRGSRQQLFPTVRWTVMNVIHSSESVSQHSNKQITSVVINAPVEETKKNFAGPEGAGAVVLCETSFIALEQSPGLYCRRFQAFSFNSLCFSLKTFNHLIPGVE